MMLAVTYNEVQRAVEIFMDEAGMDRLIANLQALKKSGSHLHMRSGAETDPVNCDLDSALPWDSQRQVFQELILTWEGDDVD